MSVSEQYLYCVGASPHHGLQGLLYPLRVSHTHGGLGQLWDLSKERDTLQNS